MKIRLRNGVVTFTWVLSLLSIPVLAADLEPVFNELKDSGENYTQTGTVCEQVARLRFQRNFPEPGYDVRTGIAYANAHRTLGELDVVVFDEKTDEAVLVGEVKCWKNLRGAKRKAEQQRSRFVRNMNSGRHIEFYSTSDRDERFSRSQFENVRRFVFVAQEGAENAGFDIELDYTLDELMRLREMLMSCQKQGECRRPGE